jgi:hypothetical protein
MDSTKELREDTPVSDIPGSYNKVGPNSIELVVDSIALAIV